MRLFLHVLRQKGKKKNEPTKRESGTFNFLLKFPTNISCYLYMYLSFPQILLGHFLCHCIEILYSAINLGTSDLRENKGEKKDDEVLPPFYLLSSKYVSPVSLQ